VGRLTKEGTERFGVVGRVVKKESDCPSEKPMSALQGSSIGNQRGGKGGKGKN